MPRIERFVMPQIFSDMFYYDVLITTPSFPSIFDALNAKKTCYHKGGVDYSTVVESSHFVHVKEPVDLKLFEIYEQAIQEPVNIRKHHHYVPENREIA